LPRLRFERQQSDIFVGDARIARQRNSIRAAELQFGRALPALGSVRVGAGRYRFNSSVQIGVPFPEREVDAYGASLGLNLDTLDTVNYPRKGYLLAVETIHLRDVDDISGLRERDELTMLDFVAPFTFGRYTIAASARYGTSTQFNAFQLGGLFNLSGTPVGQIAGSTAVLLRLNGYRNISDAFGDLSVPVYIGFSLETGDAVDRDVSLSLSRAKHAGSLYVGTDSTFGPLYLAVGKTAGGSKAAYLFWGRPR
jgi:NTE family protein